MYSPVEVAWRVLSLATEKGIQLTNLQLQKLVYFSHGYLLAWKNRPLVNKPFQSWKYGPVSLDIYDAVKGHGELPINVTDVKIPTKLDDDGAATSVINKMLELYGVKPAKELVGITHRYDTPWYEVWYRRDGFLHPFTEIPDSLIQNHFRKALANPNGVNGL